MNTATATVDGKSETILVGRNGMTLYYYALDKGAGKVTCTGTCLSNWPPLLLAGGDKPIGGPGVTGTLGSVPNPDSGTQLTYNGWPLYFWIKDTKPGDTTGQNVAGKWAVVTPNLPANT